MKPGDRVLALLDASDGKVRSFGEGVYAGDFPPPEEVNPGGLMISTNPRIDLDNGDSVWGFECWWGPVDKVRAKVPDSWKWEIVRVADVRKSYPSTEELREIPEEEITRPEMLAGARKIVPMSEFKEEVDRLAHTVPEGRDPRASLLACIAVGELLDRKARPKQSGDELYDMAVDVLREVDAEIANSPKGGG